MHLYKQNKYLLATKTFIISLLSLTATFGVVYASSELIKLLDKKSSYADFNNNINYDFSQDMNYDQKMYYKKINNYNEYLKYKSKWSTLIDMTEDDFVKNFLIILAVENESMKNFSVSDVYSDSTTLYIVLNNDSDNKDFNENNSIIGIKLSKDIERNSIKIIKNESKIVNNNYTSISDIPDNYSIDDAKKDNCLVIQNNKIISDDTNALTSFINNSNSGSNCFIRIYNCYTTNTGNRVTIKDLEYKNNKYALNVRTLNDSSKDLFYYEYSKIEKKVDNRYGTYYTLYNNTSSDDESTTLCLINF